MRPTPQSCGAQHNEEFEMAKKTKTVSATIDPTLTLAQLSRLYLEHIEEEGKSGGTIFSYGMELKLAQSEIGGETLVSGITPHLIERFNACDRVMRLKTGKPKAQPSIDKTRRVIRLALTWAVQAGLIASAPYATKDDATPPAPAAADEPKKTRRAKRVEPETTETPAPEEIAAPAA
jgi:hypothetical protein